MTPEGEKNAQAKLKADYAKLDAIVAACRYCKAAKRNQNRTTAMCRKHALESHLIYVTSPVSETYWSS